MTDWDVLDEFRARLGSTLAIFHSGMEQAIEIPPDHVLQPSEINGFIEGLVDRVQKEDANVRVHGFGAVSALPLLHKATTTITFENIGFSIKLKDSRKPAAGEFHLP